MHTIEILGRENCPNCAKVEEMARGLDRELDEELSVQKVEDFEEIARRGVMSMPGIVVDGEVKSSGRVPNRDELRAWIRDEE